jgi:phosphomevalonate kinase
MTPIRATAPGKAILSGEYAVLCGAPAIATAVDRRAVVEIDATGDDYHCVNTPGYATGRWRFTADQSGQIDWLDEPPAGGLDLFETAWRAALPESQTGLSVTVDTSSFFAAGLSGKIGLGGSAAAMTALIAALTRLRPGKIGVCALALGAHRALQQGLGSGVDVATSYYGGVIEFRKNASDEPLRRAWPDGLGFRFLWSGTPANTVAKIAGLDVADADAGYWTPLTAAADIAATAWAGGDVSQIMDAYDQYTAALRQFSIDRSLGIFDAGHSELHEQAESVGLVYKPCGAGGGDIGIVLADEQEDGDRRLGQFCDQAEAAGFQLLTLQSDPDGIRVSGGDKR